MALVNEKYYIDKDLKRKLATNEYTRNGSVVREAEGPRKGQIVMHLDPVEENNKVEKTVVLVGVVVGASLLVYKGFNKMKKDISCRKKNKKLEAKNKFQIVSQDYIKDIGNRDSSIESINRLMDA